jgi:hypothetical protein
MARKRILVVWLGRLIEAGMGRRFAHNLLETLAG